MLPKLFFSVLFILCSTNNTKSQHLNPNLKYDSINDVEGNTYKTIKIGTQIWMAENLRTTKYRNNISIPNISDNTQWQNNATGAWSYYNNDATNNNPYGKLYNWYAVNNSNGICPTGWHVPTDAEWTTMINVLDPNAAGGVNVNTAGGKMKSTGTQYWISPNTGATNSSGFSGLSGGERYGVVFNGIGSFGRWWSSTENKTGNAWYRNLFYLEGDVSRSGNYKSNGCSVRCLRD
jgi:uncharacterized protein (TIGR02145 family)